LQRSGKATPTAATRSLFGSAKHATNASSSVAVHDDTAAPSTKLNTDV